MNIAALKMDKFKSSSQHGVAVMATVIALPLILAVGTLAFDFGQMYVIKSQLQNAADACALAALDEINSNSASSTEIAAAKKAGAEVAKLNNVGFKDTDPTINETTDITVVAAPNIGDISITCKVRHEYKPTFLSLSGYLTSPTIMASAKAGFVPGANTCALPLATCGQRKLANQVYVGELGNSTQTTGKDQVKWAAFVANGGNTQNKDISSALRGEDACNIDFNNQQVAPENGLRTSVTQDYNTRFGIFKSSDKNIEETIRRDFTGAYKSTLDAVLSNQLSSVYNAYLAAKATNAAAEADYTYTFPNTNNGNGNGGGRGNGNSGGTSTTTPPVTLKFGSGEYIIPRDTLTSTGSNRRVVVAPHFDGTCPTTSAKPNSWDCVLLVNPVSKAGDTIYLLSLGDYKTAAACSQSRLAGSNNDNARVPALID